MGGGGGGRGGGGGGAEVGGGGGGGGVHKARKVTTQPSVSLMSETMENKQRLNC